MLGEFAINLGQCLRVSTGERAARKLRCVFQTFDVRVGEGARIDPRPQVPGAVWVSGPR